MEDCNHKWDGKEAHRLSTWSTELKDETGFGESWPTCSKCGLSKPMFELLTKIKNRRGFWASFM